jgi:hypothetical protein
MEGFPVKGLITIEERWIEMRIPRQGIKKITMWNHVF